jgi:magnesium transporter
MASGWEPVHVSCIDYSPEQYQILEVTNIRDFLAQHRPSWSRVRWINIDGLTNMEVIRLFAEKYQLHPLAIEDIVQRGQRAKAEDYPGSEGHPGRLFIVFPMLLLQADDRLVCEQVSFFLGRNTLLSFQASRRDVFNPVRQRLRIQDSRLRQNDVSFLLYNMLDALVDHLFPILEYYSENLEDLEQLVLVKPSKDTLPEIHRFKRELILLRRSVWPVRELLSSLQRERHEGLSEVTQTYLRDVYDHVIQIIDLLESYREFATSLTETYISQVSHRMNDIVKTLTIISTIFVPLTFFAGVYGMNMPIPENQSEWAYPIFWIVCLGAITGMLSWFKHRGWF